MRNSIVTYDTNLWRRFHNLAADATLHAHNGLEVMHIQQVVQAAREGAITIRDAHGAIATLRRQQNERQRAA